MMRVTKDRFYQAVRIVNLAAAHRERAGILNNILVEARDATLTLKATNLELAVEARLEAIGDDHWSWLVDGDLLEFVTAHLDNEWLVLTGVLSGIEFAPGQFTPTRRRLVMQSGHALFRLEAAEAGDFPAIPSPTDPVRLTFSAGELATALRRVAFACLRDSDTRQELQGVLWEIGPSGPALAATDAARLAFLPLDQNVEGRIRAVVPWQSVQAALAVLDAVDGGEPVSVELTNGLWVMSAGPFSVASKTVPERKMKFPEFRHLFLDSPANRVVLPRRQTLEAVRRLSALALDAKAVLRIRGVPESPTVVLEVEERGAGEAYEPVDLVDGHWPEGTSLTYQAHFVWEMLASLDSEQVELAWNEPDRASQWTVPGDGWKALLMPVRV